MKISDHMGKTIRTFSITAAIVIVPFAIYYFGIRSQQETYHIQRYARQLDLVARQFRESVVYLERLTSFRRQELSSRKANGNGKVERCPDHKLACRRGAPFERFDLDLRTDAGIVSMCNGRGSFTIDRAGPDVDFVAHFDDEGERLEPAQQTEKMVEVLRRVRE